MKVSSVFLYGKITRQIFAIFLVFALLPVSVLSWLAIERISESTDLQVSREIENEVKNLSLLVLERLQFVESTLQLRLMGFNGKPLVSFTDSIPGKNQLAVSLQAFGALEPQLTDSTRQHLASGRGVLIRRLDREKDRVQMVMAANKNQIENGLITTRLLDTYVLGEEESRSQAVETCIFDADQALLYATSAAMCRQLLSAAGGRFGHKGQIQFDPAQAYLSHYWSLFLHADFGVPPWTVAVIQRENDILAESEAFKTTFLIAALGVILSLSLVSIVLIRRKMAPLPEIMAAIERVGRQRYDQPAVVNSGDEFEELANAFNNMSGKVDRQIITMGSLAEIDQLILTRVKKEDLVRVVLEKTDTVIDCDAVGMLMLEDGEATGALYCLADQGGDDFTTETLTLNKHLMLALETDGQWLHSSAANNDSWFNGFGNHISHVYLLPVHQEARLAAVIVLAHVQQSLLNREAISTAKSYASRIAVALANAEWEDKLFRQAHYDNLTGLPNRLSLLDNLRRSIKRAQRSTRHFAVMFFDLDDFKLVNDSLGHIAGDEMIAEIARRLHDCLRGGDIVARMGGDEFVIISNTFDSLGDAVTGASQMARKIAGEISLPLQISGRELRASSSLGIALYPRDGEDADTLLKNADAAMYHAKSKGRGNFVFFSEGLNAESEALMQMSSELKRALEVNEFELHYQPKVDIASNTIVGAEALIRWQHPERGMVAPGEFIEVAERMGLINAIGDWTLHEACRQMVEWRDAGIPLPLMSVNISAIQIHQENLAAKIKRVLHDYQLPAQYLEIEIVEGVLVEDMVAATAKLETIRELGVHISIDDYGTGYSSLSYVKAFPVDTLKIDRCFIINLCTDPADQAIVNSTIVLAHNLGMKVIAEGVEKADQVAKLKALGCDEIQGYYFSKPLPAEEFLVFLQAGL